MCDLRGDFVSAEERAQAWQVAAAVRRDSGWLVDAAPWSLVALQHRLVLSAAVKLTGILAWGRDVRDKIEVPKADEYAREALPVCASLVARVRGDVALLIYPLGYPDPKGDFNGYDHSEAVPGSAETAPATRLLVRTVCACALGVLAVRRQLVIGSKAQAVAAYRADVGAGADTLAAIWQTCRLDWGYRVPEEAEDRALLRGLCAAVPALENELLRAYREFGSPGGEADIVFP
jgi:hypothetical protein